MTTRSLSTLLAVILVMAVATTLAAAPDTTTTATASAVKADTEYAVKLDRPGKVGDRFEVTSIGQSKNEMMKSQEGKVLEENVENFSFEVNGTLEILAVNQRGGATKVSLALTKAVKSDQGKAEKQLLLPPGQTVIIERSGKEQQVTVKDSKEAVPEDLVAVLKRAVILDSGTRPTNDEVFGTSKKVRVGDSWQANVELVAKVLTETWMIAKKENTEAKATITGVAKVNGLECLEVKMEMESRNFTSTKLPLGPDAKMKESKFTGTFVMACPTDPAIVPPQINVTNGVHMVLEVPCQEGKVAVVVWDLTETVRFEMRPVVATAK